LVGGVGVSNINNLIESIKAFTPRCEGYQNLLRKKENAKVYKMISRVLEFFKTLSEEDINNNSNIFTKNKNDIIDFIELSKNIIDDSYQNKPLQTRESLASFAKLLEDGLIKDFSQKDEFENINNQKNISSINELTEGFRREFRKIQKESEEYKQTANSIIEELEKKKKSETKSIESYANSIKEIKNYAESAKKAFDEDHKLHEAKIYWQNKAKRHNTNAMWSFSLFLVPIFIIIVLMLLKTQKLIASDSNQTIINTITTINESSLLTFLPYLIIFSLLIWISRIFLKVAFSNLHLQEEAVEKETQILTYLSLIKEGAGLEKEDRKLILEAIFRPSTNGLIKDESNVTLLDIANIFNKK
ncbi:MAG: hypothetical protein KAH72_03950, partial [Flavobacteriaceae bacterium]|nr:hypothetical protein [Flavobacteriaceae bacterium]